MSSMKWFLLSLPLSLALLLWTACGDDMAPEDAAPEDAAPEDAAGENAVVIWHAWEGAALNSLKDVAMKHDVELVSYDSHAALRDALESGGAPDGFIGPHRWGWDNMLDDVVTEGYCLPDSECAEVCSRPEPPRLCRYVRADTVWNNNLGFSDKALLASHFTEVGLTVDVFQAGMAHLPDNYIDLKWFPYGIPIWWWWNVDIEEIEVEGAFLHAESNNELDALRFMYELYGAEFQDKLAGAGYLPTNSKSFAKREDKLRKENPEVSGLFDGSQRADISQNGVITISNQ